MTDNETRQVVSVRLPVTMLEMIDAEAAVLGRTRSDVLLDWLNQHVSMLTRPLEGDILQPAQVVTREKLRR